MSTKTVQRILFPSIPKVLGTESPETKIQKKTKTGFLYVHTKEYGAYKGGKKGDKDGLMPGKKLPLLPFITKNGLIHYIYCTVRSISDREEPAVILLRKSIFPPYLSPEQVEVLRPAGGGHHVPVDVVPVRPPFLDGVRHLQPPLQAAGGVLGAGAVHPVREQEDQAGLETFSDPFSREIYCVGEI